jgi:predicted enzyme related to lactoylglutathione lyase
VSWNTYIAVDSADESAQKIEQAGGTVAAEPFDVLDVGRMAVLADPEGAASASGRRRATSGRSSSTSRARGTSASSVTDQFRDDVQAHWSVTFAVDDADATAERAAKLGGTIDAPPFDAGPTRVAVVTDPQGARLSVSKYDPSA